LSVYDAAHGWRLAVPLNPLWTEYQNFISRLATQITVQEEESIVGAPKLSGKAAQKLVAELKRYQDLMKSQAGILPRHTLIYPQDGRIILVDRLRGQISGISWGGSELWRRSLSEPAQSCRVFAGVESDSIIYALCNEKIIRADPAGPFFSYSALPRRTAERTRGFWIASDRTIRLLTHEGQIMRWQPQWKSMPRYGAR
jgi:hypothetical protein